MKYDVISELARSNPTKSTTSKTIMLVLGPTCIPFQEPLWKDGIRKCNRNLSNADNNDSSTAAVRPKGSLFSATHHVSEPSFPFSRILCNFLKPYRGPNQPNKTGTSTTARSPAVSYLPQQYCELSTTPHPPCYGSAPSRLP